MRPVNSTKSEHWWISSPKPASPGSSPGMVGQVAGYRRHRVGVRVGAAALRLDVRPDHDAEQTLFGAVQDVAEEVAVLRMYYGHSDLYRICSSF